MQCTRLPTTEEEEEQREEMIATTTTVISPVRDDQAVEQQQQLQLEADQESVRLIPDCLEHIFKYLPTSDKGRVAQVIRWHKLYAKLISCRCLASCSL